MLFFGSKRLEENYRKSRKAWAVSAQLASFLTKEVYSLQSKEKLEALMCAVFPETSGSLYVYNRTSNLLETVAVFGKDESGLENFHPEACTCMAKAEPVFSQTPVSSGCSHFTEEVLGPCWCIPLKTEEDINGLLVLSSCDEKYTDDGATTLFQDKLSVISGLLSIYLENMEMKQRFKQHSIRDPLTGLYNRRHMEESLYREVAAARRRELPIGMIMLHVDNLLEIRDSLGRQAAEQLMWEIGKRLPSYIRTEDIPCRYSKMAFTVILPTANMEITVNRAEMIREEIENLQVGFGTEILTTTLSMGVGVLPNHAEDAEGLLQRTEEALYAAVYEGGDSIKVAQLQQ